MTTVVTLLLVLLMADGKVTEQARTMPSMGACKAAEASALEAVKNSFDVVNVGVICVKTEFDPAFKPHA